MRFVSSGFSHILDGTDHLLFLFCLVIPFRRFRSLVVDRHGVHVAHSITLIASAYDLAPDALWFPPLIETLIAASIVYMALENIVGVPRTSQRRWMIAFGFGLVHGFGFSFALRETLQFAGSHLLTSLLAFNVGVELGQLLVLVLLVPALHAAVPLRRRRADRHDHPVGARRAHRVALDDRAWERLRQFAWPALNRHLAPRVRWLMAAVLAAALVWLVAASRLAQEGRPCGKLAAFLQAGSRARR